MNEMTRKCRCSTKNIVLIVTQVAAVIVVLMFFNQIQRRTHLHILLVNLVLLCFTILVYARFCRKNLFALWAMPLGWFVCAFPIIIYSVVFAYGTIYLLAVAVSLIWYMMTAPFFASVLLSLILPAGRFACNEMGLGKPAFPVMMTDHHLLNAGGHKIVYERTAQTAKYSGFR